MTLRLVWNWEFVLNLQYEALGGFKVEPDLVLKIIKDYTNLVMEKQSFVLGSKSCKYPVNDRADAAAKSATVYVKKLIFTIKYKSSS